MTHAADDADLIALAGRLGLHSLDLEQLRAINRLRSAPVRTLPMSVRQDPSTWGAG